MHYRILALEARQHCAADAADYGVVEPSNCGDPDPKDAEGQIAELVVRLLCMHKHAPISKHNDAQLHSPHLRMAPHACSKLDAIASGPQTHAASSIRIWGGGGGGSASAGVDMSGG